MIVVQGHTVGVKQFFATTYEGEVVTMAVKDFRHLVPISGELKKYSFEQFANLIEMHYDCLDNKRNAEIVSVLREVHGRQPH